MNFSNLSFLISVHSLSQLPDEDLPEIAFAGRSNVGKSSLMNCLFNRKNFVKVSGKPGKTQGLNYFSNDYVNFVDLPGYGFAKVSKKMQDKWQHLISTYITTRTTLRCVVVIVDIRHSPRPLDMQLIEWLKSQNIEILPVYTKADKLSSNNKNKQARMLDAGHNFNAAQRVLFSAKTGEGRDILIEKLEKFIQ
jgi:GTP-binding protein